MVLIPAIRLRYPASLQTSPTPSTCLERGALSTHQAVVFFFLDLVLRFVRTLGLSASMPALQISA